MSSLRCNLSLSAITLLNTLHWIKRGNGIYHSYRETDSLVKRSGEMTASVCEAAAPLLSLLASHFTPWAWRLMRFTFSVCGLFANQSSIAWKFQDVRNRSPSCMTRPFPKDIAERIKPVRAWVIILSSVHFLFFLSFILTKVKDQN